MGRAEVEVETGYLGAGEQVRAVLGRQIISALCKTGRTGRKYRLVQYKQHRTSPSPPVYRQPIAAYGVH